MDVACGALIGEDISRPATGMQQELGLSLLIGSKMFYVEHSYKVCAVQNVSGANDIKALAEDCKPEKSRNVPSMISRVLGAFHQTALGDKDRTVQIGSCGKADRAL